MCRVKRVLALRRKRQQQASLAALQAAHARLQALFAQSNDGVFLMDFEGNYLEVNQRGLDMLGYTQEEMRGLNARQTIVPEALSSSFNVLARLMAGEKIPPYERVFLRKDGTRFVGEVNVELVCDAHGAPLHLQSVVRDISERKRQQELDLKAALEHERVQLLARFIEHASHEFRTPLSVIGVGVYLMARSDNAEKRHEKAQMIQTQLSRIIHLVDTLLMLVRLESDDYLLARDSIQLNELLHLVGERLRLATHFASVTWAIDPDLPFIEGDYMLLYEAFKQLGDNALRYTPEGGSLTITTRYDSTEQRIMVTLADTGVGIEEADMPRVFETFWRKDTTHTTYGFGLGLPIAKRIIERHGGTLILQSVPQQGTTAIVQLPLVLGETS